MNMPEQTFSSREEIITSDGSNYCASRQLSPSDNVRVVDNKPGCAALDLNSWSLEVGPGLIPESREQIGTNFKLLLGL
jgi:hypothetical protein